MSTVIRLDTNAVASLIENDPELKLELQRGVVAEICRRLYQNYVHDDVSRLITTLFASHQNDLVLALQQDTLFKAELAEKFTKRVAEIKGDSYYSKKVIKLTPDVQAKVDEAVANPIAKLLEEAGLRATKIVEQAVERTFAEIEPKILQRVENRLIERIDREIGAEIDRRVAERLRRALEA